MRQKLKLRKKIFFSGVEPTVWSGDWIKKMTTSELFSRFSGKFNQTSTEDIICKSFHVSEETYGIATSIFGTCRRKKDPHHFRIEANRINSKKVKESLHKNAKTPLFDLNYQLV